MTQIVASDRIERALLVAIHGSFSGFHIVSGACLHFDETQDVLVPSDQIDFAAMMWGTKISPHHHISATTQEKIRVFFAAFAGALVFGTIVSAKSALGEPVESADSSIREAAGQHASE